MLSLSRLPQPRLSPSLLSPFQLLYELFTMAITYSSVPASLYDVHPNDFPNQGHQVPINRSFDVGSGKSFPAHSLFPYPLPFQQPNEVSYFQPPPQVELAPTFPTNGVAYNGGMAHNFQPYNAVPYLQTQPSFISASSTISDSSSSRQGALTPASAPSVRKQLQKANSKSKSDGKRVTRNATQYAMRELLTGQPKRKRGPNKRPPGTSFSDLLVRSFRPLLVYNKRPLTSRNFSRAIAGRAHARSPTGPGGGIQGML